jgi:RecA/RadA recombinase
MHNQSTKKGNNMSLMDKLAKVGSIKAGSLADSVLFNKKDLIQTSVPIINIALSGKLDGGLSSGLTVIAGLSKHFKSNLGLIMVKAYMKQYPESICMFYDSEFGVTPEYIQANGIDPNRVLHIPIEHVEQLKFDISKRLEGISRGDKVIIFIDSVGNLASKKEVEDALDEKSVADMSRAKAMKSLFRIITPHLTTKDLPCIVVNHTYKELGLYPKDIVAGGTGLYYSANAIWIIGRSQEKDADGIQGYNFTINIEKSRMVKEKSKCTFQVLFDSGISRWSGLMDIGIELGYTSKLKNGWYTRTGDEKNYRFADTLNKEFWLPILTDKEFQTAVQARYQLGVAKMFEQEEGDEE